MASEESSEVRRKFMSVSPVYFLGSKWWYRYLSGYKFEIRNQIQKVAEYGPNLDPSPQP